MPREAPVTMATLVSFSDIDILLLARFGSYIGELGSTRPSGAEDDRAEVHPLVGWILQRQHVCLYISERRPGLLDDALGKVIDDVFLEVRLARVARTNFVSVFM